MYAVWSGKRCADYFATTKRQTSSNYCIGVNGDIAMSVEEKNRAWTTSSNWCDQRAVTIEVANSSLSGDTPVSAASMKSLIALVADICKRNGIKKCTYTGDKSGVLQMHKWYDSTSCPGKYLGSRFSYIAEEVNKILNKETAIKAPDATNNPELAKKSINEISKEVIDGKWGNGSERKSRLESAGYNYTTVQNKVNEILLGAKPAKSTTKTSGKWLVTTPLGMNVRSAPSTSAAKVASYQAGQTVNINSTVTQNGYIWGVYTSYSGYTRYIALQPVNGNPYGKWV